MTAQKKADSVQRKSLLALAVMLLLLMQCLAGLLSLDHHVAADPDLSPSPGLLTEHAPVKPVSAAEHALYDNSRHPLSCCDQDRQPLSLPEFALPALLLVVLLCLLPRIVPQRPVRRRSPPLGRYRLHTLHCCWLH